ncbi:MAG TPA: serine hydrolase [Gemmatimonadales bacterium]|jgi:CubicO group peptidase (beta-lactamase class C family)|nr:serine hydrolase [Gemmatimonadales bacterium]
MAALLVVVSREASAQKPTARPPAPSIEREAPVGAPVPVAPQLTRADVEAWLDGYLPYALQRGDIAGAVVVVVKDGAILLEKGYGYADVAKHREVDPQRTLFRPGSISKLFTWTAAMQLVEQGKLNLDHDVNEYLDFKIPPAFGKPITLRNIMTHTPGFEEVEKNVIVSDSVGFESLEAFLKDWTPHRIFPPGQVPAYSNYATALMGYVIQRVSGERFEEYIERHIFGPLKMEHATFRQPLPNNLKADMSRGYQVASGDAKPYEVVIPAPAGSLAAAGHDMGLFMIAHLQNGRLGSAEILKPETAKLMHGTALTILPRVNRMLLGFYETNRNGRRAIAHGGDSYWFHSDLHLFIDDGVGIFISMNSPGKEGAAGPIRSTLFEQFADRYLPGETEDGRVDPKTAAEHAKLIAGHYDNSRRAQSSFLSILGLIGDAKVTTNDDSTISLAGLDGLNGQPKKWREVSPFIWREVDGKNWLAAKVEGGKVAMLSGDEISPFMMFLPSPWWRSSVWLLPLLEVSLAALLLTLLLWPTTALVRRHYRTAFPLEGVQASAYRWIRLAVAATLLTLLGWFGLFSVLNSRNPAVTDRLDPWVWLLHLASLVVFVGAAAIALWHCRVVWAGRRRWPARLWSVVLAISLVTVLGVALIYKFIAFSAHF